MLANYEESKKTGIFHKYLFVTLIIVVFLVGFLIGQNTDKSLIDGVQSGEVYNKDAVPEFLSRDVDFNIFWDTWETIKESYVDQPINETQLFYGAVEGLVNSLGDVHSVFLDPKMTEEFNQELSGSFEGIGAEIAKKNDQIMVVAPLPDTPAEKAGLKAGDKIMMIDEKLTIGMTVDQAVSLIRGPKGTEVKLTINRDDEETNREFTLKRNTIKIVSVSWKMSSDNIAVIELKYFNSDTEKEFNRIVNEIIKKDPKGIILDMRNNPGGLLDTAIAVASEWVDNGIVVYERYADGTEIENESVGTARLKNYKTVVLINGGSASGSEIVAGALKDLKLATLIGEKSFGKGSVQTMFTLKDGSSLKLTIAKWLTPNKTAIDGQGIMPDTEIKLSDDDWNNNRDPQMDEAVKVLGQ